MTLYRIKPGAAAFLRAKFSTPPAIGRLVEVEAWSLHGGVFRFLDVLPDAANPTGARIVATEREWQEWKEHLEPLPTPDEE